MKGYLKQNTDERDRLIESFLPQIKFIAQRLASKLPPTVERDDLISAGVLGLIDAVNKFDPSRGVLFKTYAETRVRGAMLDSLRDLDWAPRSARRRAREVEEAYARIERERGRPATEEEVADALDLSLSDFQTLLGELNALQLTALDDDGGDGGSSLAHSLAGDPAHTPSALFESGEGRRALADAIDRLPERERQVVALYFVEELTLKEVGSVLGVTESRASQLRTQALLRLRSALAPLRCTVALAF